MRPQLGSCPKMALFTSEDPTTLFATVLASAALAAPSTSHSISTVAPSPSQAIDFASPCSSAVSAASSAAPSGLAASAMGAPPARPDVRPSTVSLVEVSPSTVIWLNEAVAARWNMARQAAGATGASHVTTDSMVAMFWGVRGVGLGEWVGGWVQGAWKRVRLPPSSPFPSFTPFSHPPILTGWIMPDPLAMPPSRTVRPGLSSTSSAALLLTRSVVVMATAARCASSAPPPSRPASLGTPALSSSTCGE